MATSLHINQQNHLGKRFLKLRIRRKTHHDVRE
jgi:hypothetical protein